VNQSPIVNRKSQIPKVVIFDIGNVLLDFDYSIAGRKLAAHSHLAAEAIQKLIDHTPLLCRYETGQLTTKQFFDEVQKVTGYRGTLAEFSGAFADIFIPAEPMIKLQAVVRQKGVPTFILSNTNELAIGHIRRNFPFFENFDGYVFSHEQGVMKPDEEIYEITERLTGRHGAEILFLDDRAINTAAAVRRGWQTILHESAEQTRAVFERLGLL
jgi:FMN phosphatase YigB (HAD superfamily)